MLTRVLFAHYVQTTPGTVFTSVASYTPLANKLYTFKISHWNSTPPATVSVAAFGSSGTVQNSGIGGSSTPDSRVTYVTILTGASPSSGSIVITCSTSVDDVIVEVTEWSGHDTSGTIVQTAKNDSILANNITVTLSSGIGAANAVEAGFFNYSGGSGATPGGSYSLGSEDVDAGDGFAQATIYLIPGTTTPSISYGGGSVALAGVAAEIKAASGALSATVNQASETDTAQPVTWAPKKRLLGQALETDTAQAITRRKSLTLGQPLETDTAQPVAWAPKKRLVGQVSEADTAQPITRRKIITLGQAIETDTAQPITRRTGLSATLGQAIETDSAQPVAWAPKRRLVGQALETDEALPIQAPAQPVAASTTGAVDWPTHGQKRRHRPDDYVRWLDDDRELQEIIDRQRRDRHAAEARARALETKKRTILLTKAEQRRAIALLEAEEARVLAERARAELARARGEDTPPPQADDPADKVARAHLDAMERAAARAHIEALEQLQLEDAIAVLLALDLI